MDYSDFLDFGYTNQELTVIEQMLYQILDMKREISELNETIRWMHSVIWSELDKTQRLKEEIRQLNQALERER
ncbi:MAG: hypothetical protein HFG75_09960 [Hungatella sp.]|nr:hypothetical protein [Hungatella sp.]